MCYNNSVNDINNSKQIISNSNSNSSDSIKDNFRTPLTPLHRGGLRGLHRGGIKGVYGRGLEVLAFSLIELSIVLIIIGLLVAGVTGGKSLIESAKTRALMNEIRKYNQAFTTFYVANGRLPGDANRDGRIDYYDDVFYNFSDDWDDIMHSYGCISAPWIELYNDKIINSISLSDCHEEGICRPYSKVFKSFYYDTSATGDMDYADAFDNSANQQEYANKAKLKMKAYSNNYRLDLVKTNIIKQIDKKIDDGERYSGRFRAICGLLNENELYPFNDDYFNDNFFIKYDDVLDGGYCKTINYTLDIN